MTHTVEELVDEIEKSIEPVRPKDRDGTSVCIKCDCLEQIRDRLLAAEEMAKALKHWKKEYQEADGNLTLYRGPLNNSEDIGDKALENWEKLK